MRTNRAGLRALVVAVAVTLIIGCIISYAVGIADGKQTLYPAISDLQACNKALSNDLYEANKELNAREELLQYSLYAKNRLPK